MIFIRGGSGGAGGSLPVLLGPAEGSTSPTGFTVSAPLRIQNATILTFQTVFASPGTPPSVPTGTGITHTSVGTVSGGVGNIGAQLSKATIPAAWDGVVTTSSGRTSCIVYSGVTSVDSFAAVSAQGTGSIFDPPDVTGLSGAHTIVRFFFSAQNATIPSPDGATNDYATITGSAGHRVCDLAATAWSPPAESDGSGLWGYTTSLVVVLNNP